MIRSEAILLPLDPGHRLCVTHAPASGDPRAVTICVAPFAEEMNKSRRMLAMGARALAEAGIAVVLLDLLGCGDSSGDFADADWARWLHDIAAVREWAAQRFAAPQWLWGVRAGALLAVQSASQHGECGLLLWQPVLSGKQHLNQFLRLKVAGAMLANAQDREGVQLVRARLGSGQRQEVAGYMLAPSLAAGLETATLSLPPGFQRTVVWCEVTADDPIEVAPGSTARISEWRATGIDVRVRVVRGPAFWQTAEIAECPELVDATRAELIAALP